MSLVGFKAQNHPQQVIKDDIDDRRTPQDFFHALHAEYAFTADAASSDANHLLPTYYTKERSGLLASWGGQRIWCNPPFSHLAPWVEKAWQEVAFGGCELVVMLLPANRCEQKFWQRDVEPYRDGGSLFGVSLTSRFLPGRLRFGYPEGVVAPAKGNRPPFGCVLLIWQRADATL